MTSVVYNDKLYNLKFPITCADVVKELGLIGNPSTIVGLRVNGIVQSLNEFIMSKNCTVSPMYFRSVEGQNMGRRTELFLMRYAIHQLYPDVSIQIKGDFGDANQFITSPQITESQLNSINELFVKLHQEELEIQELPQSYLSLHFVETHQSHSKSLLESLNNPTYSCITLNNFASLTLSQPCITTPKVLPTTSTFEIVDGLFTIYFPKFLHTDSYRLEQHPKITSSMLIDSSIDIGYLNNSISSQETKDILIESENHHIKQMSAVLSLIQSRPTQLVLVAGPSSSGKSTFSQKLALALKSFGYCPLVLGVDNYYVHKQYCPLDENGKRDWECIDSLRLSLLNDHLTSLMNGKEVTVPVFDFATSTPVQNAGKKVKLEKNGIIIMEGIHCLNEKLTTKVDSSKKIKIFIAPLTNGVCLTDDTMLNNNILRIQRRLVRDSLFRSYSANKTLKSWDDVAGAEKTWIYPFIKDADFVFSTFLIFEVNALITYSLNLLRTVKQDSAVYGFAQSYFRLLSHYLPIDSTEFAKDSIIREFIGGGVFDCH
ncbi:Phosphoribulokinase/uridine kinase domain-containing protein [Entamoeba marina]